MIRKWVEDIRTKTGNMDREAKAEYIMNYYWYHILLGTLLMGLLILGIYHVSWGKKKTDFSLVVVNQDINYARDERIQHAFAEFCGLSPKHVQVDSDYMISYGDVQLEGINESSFEKFFFGWSAGAIDAVVMPESFYEYCKEQNGTFVELAELAKAAGLDVWEKALADAKGSDVYGGQVMESVNGQRNRQEIFLMEEGACVGVYVEKTDLADEFIHNEQDPYVLVFPGDMTHKRAAGKFLEYAGGQSYEKWYKH